MHTTEEYMKLLTQYKEQNAERYGIKNNLNHLDYTIKHNYQGFVNQGCHL